MRNLLVFGQKLIRVNLAQTACYLQPSLTANVMQIELQCLHVDPQ